MAWRSSGSDNDEMVSNLKRKSFLYCSSSVRQHSLSPYGSQHEYEGQWYAPINLAYYCDLAAELVRGI